MFLIYADQFVWYAVGTRSLAARLASTKKSHGPARKIEWTVALQGEGVLAEASNVNGLRQEPSLWT